MKKKESVVCFLALGFVLGVASLSFAMTAPVAGAFAFDIYDIGVNKILKGPIGFIAGLGAVVYSGISMVKGDLMTAVPALLGGGAIIKSDTIASSLGMLF